MRGRVLTRASPYASDVHIAGGRCHSRGRGGKGSSLSSPEARSLLARLPWRRHKQQTSVGERTGKARGRRRRGGGIAAK